MKRMPIKTKPQPWTYERIETLKSLWAEGQTASQIAKVLGGASRSAVCAKVHRLKLKPRASDEHRSAEQRQRRSKPTLVIAPKPKVLENEPAALLQDDGSPFGTLAIRDGLCRWRHGDVRESGVHYCAHPIKPHSPYCPFHSDKAWDKSGTAKSKLKAKDRAESYHDAEQHRRAA
jgi:GcrA cell cycle regulator